MKSNKILILGIILILGLFLVGCSNNQETTVPVENPITTQEVDTPTDVPIEATQPKSDVPEDVPIYPDSSDIQVANENNIVYQANADIETVAAFYQEEFANYGWDAVKNPDTVVGNMAQLTRHNAAGDRMALALQYNPIGEFTIVQLNITRAR